MALLLSQIAAHNDTDNSSSNYYIVTENAVIPRDFYKDAPNMIEGITEEIIIPNMNKVDSLGQKSGLWVERNNMHFTIDTYVAGKKNGLSRMYLLNYTTNTYIIKSIEYYENDTLCRQQQYFFKDGYYLVDRISRLQPHFYSEASEHYSVNEELDLLYQAYTMVYKKGLLIEEGWVVFCRGFLSSRREVGEWKRY